MNRISPNLVRTGIVVLAVCLAAGCTKPVNLTEADNNGQVTLKQGQELTIALEANPTTGYRWELAECNQSILIQQGESSDAASQPVRPGSSGLESWRFAAKAEGETELRLVYHRPWEEDTEPAQTFTVKVVVR